MLFIALLIASTFGIAGAAAYFSVYGLAYTFSGVFWSVVAMGTSLEAGKLIAASYLYRYWDRTNLWLKSYLLFGIASLMILTSTGIFGYLSSGYQQDVLPLKQKQEQVTLLEDERTRALARKKQIDDLLAGQTSVTTVNKANGTIDPNAARLLREASKSRAAVAGQYKTEQETITKRVGELDTQMLALKQELIKVEAHTGPITYIAKAFGFGSDDATKYLIFLIIFAFDPMAVALTIATNTALKHRKDDLEAAAKADVIEDAVTEVKQPDALMEPEVFVYDVPTPKTDAAFKEFIAAKQLDEQEDDKPTPMPPYAPVVEAPVFKEPINLADLKPVEVAPEPVEEPFADDEPRDPEPEPVVEPAPVIQRTGAPRRQRAYSGLNQNLTSDKIAEIVNHYRYLKGKIDAGDTLSADEQWEFDSAENILRRSGYSMYLD